MKKILLSLFTIAMVLTLSTLSSSFNTAEAASHYYKKYKHKSSHHRSHRRSHKRHKRRGGGGCQTLSSATLHRKASPYNASILSASRKYGVNANLIKAIITIESCFRSRARGSLGEKGLMQLMPKTARRFNIKNGYNPYENVHGGSRYLRSLLNRYHGNMTKAIAAYNAGAGTIDKGRIPNRRYVNKVLHAYRKFSSSKAPTMLHVPKKSHATTHVAKSRGSYRVKQGDTIYEVMRKTGTPVKQIIKLNGLHAPYHLKVGQSLRLNGHATTHTAKTWHSQPSAHRQPIADVYIVQSNDTIYNIMRQTGVPIEKIIRLNHLSVPYSISKGQEIRLR